MTAEESKPNDGGRLLIISNRLPLTIKRSDDGHYDFSMSSGGLVTGLSGLSKTMTYEWYGWPGLQVPEEEVSHMKEKLKKECNAHPVFIDDDLADKHYNGFSSRFHHLRFLSLLTHCSDLCILQMRSCGLSSTTTPARLPLTSQPGPLTTRSTSSSPRPSLPTSKTMI